METVAIKKTNIKLEQRIKDKIVEREKEIEKGPNEWIDFDNFIKDFKKDL